MPAPPFENSGRGLVLSFPPGRHTRQPGGTTDTLSPSEGPGPCAARRSGLPRTVAASHGVRCSPECCMQPACGPIGLPAPATSSTFPSAPAVSHRLPSAAGLHPQLHPPASFSPPSECCDPRPAHRLSRNLATTKEADERLPWGSVPHRDISRRRPPDDPRIPLPEPGSVLDVSHVLDGLLRHADFRLAASISSATLSLAAHG